MSIEAHLIDQQGTPRLQQRRTPLFERVRLLVFFHRNYSTYRHYRDYGNYNAILFSSRGFATVGAGTMLETLATLGTLGTGATLAALTTFWAGTTLAFTLYIALGLLHQGTAAQLHLRI